MSNDYYNAVATVTRFTLARASTVKSILAEIVTGFAKLPGENALKQNRVAYAADTGSANVYAITLSDVDTSYTDGMQVRVKILTTNTGASTLNVSAIGAAAIKRIDGTDVEAGDLTAGDIHDFTYDGTNFVLVSGSRQHMAGMASNLAANLTFSGNPAFTGAPDFSSRNVNDIFRHRSPR